MNWVIGYIGYGRDTKAARLVRAKASQGTTFVDTERSFLAGAGEYPTLLSGQIQGGEPTDRWIVLGLAFEAVGGRLQLIDDDRWSRILAEERPNVDLFDGHFCVLRVVGDTVDVLNDALGLRTMYFISGRDGTAFSSRLDWLTDQIDRSSFDFESLGAQWLGRADLGSGTGIVGLERLGQSGQAELTTSGCRIRNRPFDPVQEEHLEVRDALLTVTNPQIPGFLEKSLACSGGLDSRVQLSGLLASPENLRLHTYGPKTHPDVTAAFTLAERVGRQIDHLDDMSTVPDLASVQQSSVATHAYAPASTAMDWTHYARLKDEGCVVIDASLGEIGRGFFYPGLRQGSGARALTEKSAEAVAVIQQQPRPDIWVPDVSSLMSKGHVAAVADALVGLKDENTDSGRLPDLLMLRLEASRYAGYAASHIDSLAVGYFPFAQLTLLRSLLATSLEERRNGKLYRSLVRSLSPSLTSVPLVRNGPWIASHPFLLSGKSAALWCRGVRLIGRGWKDNRTERFLRALEPAVRSLIRSSHTRGFDGYDTLKLERLVDGYYDAKHNEGWAVDRWLSFELWRLGMLGIHV